MCLWMKFSKFVTEEQANIYEVPVLICTKLLLPCWKVVTENICFFASSLKKSFKNSNPRQFQPPPPFYFGLKSKWLWVRIALLIKTYLGSCQTSLMDLFYERLKPYVWLLKYWKPLYKTDRFWKQLIRPSGAGGRRGGWLQRRRLPPPKFSVDAPFKCALFERRNQKCTWKWTTKITSKLK